MIALKARSSSNSVRKILMDKLEHQC